MHPGRPRGVDFPHRGPDDAARDKAIRSIFGEQMHTLYIRENVYYINLAYVATVYLHSWAVYCFLLILAVANISFETTEEQLRSVLCEVGPVVSLK